jgi:hypothetical protein
MSNDNSELSHYPGRKARQGEIVLRRPWQRAVFIAGLAGCALLILLAILLPHSVL